MSTGDNYRRMRDDIEEELKGQVSICTKCFTVGEIGATLLVGLTVTSGPTGIIDGPNIYTRCADLAACDKRVSQRSQSESN